jgi:hypothetical protein
MHISSNGNSTCDRLRRQTAAGLGRQTQALRKGMVERLQEFTFVGVTSRLGLSINGRNARAEHSYSVQQVVSAKSEL